MKVSKTNTRQKIRMMINIASFLAFPLTIYYLSPVVCIFGAKAGVINGSLLMFAILFLSALLLGRAYCGWVCPAGTLKDNYQFINNKRIKHNWIKYIFWIPWLAAMIILFIRSGGISRIEILHHMDHPLSILNKGGVIVYFSIILLITALSLLVGRHAFCHKLCWMAGFMVVGAWIGKQLRIPVLHIKVDKEKCNDCGICTNVCPMSIDVQEAFKNGPIASAECINCGSCADNCNRKALSYTFRRMK